MPLIDRIAHFYDTSTQRWYHLPPLVSTATLGQLAGAVGFANVRTAEWSAVVAPFRQAWAMRNLAQGYRQGTIKFGLIQGQQS